MIRGGGAEGRNFPPKRWLLVPRGVFFGDFHEKTMISSLSPTFGERGTFPPPPTQNLAMVMLFQWFWGVQFHPSRVIMLFPVISQYFHYFSCFHENMWKFRENTKKYQLFAFGAENAPRNPLKTTVITMVSGGGGGKAPKAPEVEEFKVFYPKIAGLLRISWNFC